MSEVIIIGAGMGGLAAAISAAARGHTVRVFEAGPRAGGKAGTTVIDGVEVDTGPSVVTLPEVFERLFEAANSRLSDHVTLRTTEPAFRYCFADGVVLDMAHEVEPMLDNVRKTLGSSAAKEMRAFLAYAKTIWEAGAPNFVYGPAPSVGSIMRLGLTRIGEVRRIDSMRSMYKGICAHVRDPHLRYLLARYATYNGSNVLTAPATLNCIAHVELGLGGFGVKGGISALVDALVDCAQRLGVTFHFDRPVAELLVRNQRVDGIKTDDGETFVAPQVVVNADVGHLVRHLLPPSNRRAVSAPTDASMSGWTGIVRAARGQGPRPAHAVLFPEHYLEEFTDIFERDRPPQTPTVYMCAQETCHRRTGWSDAEPLFIMANSPPEPVDAPRNAEVHAQLRDSAVARIREQGLIAPNDALVWERTPTGLAERFPGSRGAIYGAASNGAMSAFKRPANRVRGLPGLYLASGSAHPGGGLPLCALSGIAAADALHADFDSSGLRRAS